MSGHTPIPLLPCPFCGDVTGPHAEPTTEDGTVWGVHCPNGQCPTFGCWVVKEFSEAGAISAWNTRAGYPIDGLDEKLLYWRGSLTNRAEDFREALSLAAATLQNARHCIAACNSHGELVEALEGSAVALEEASKLLFAKGLQGCASIMMGHRDIALAAISKAKGEAL
jgi:hypothetical protein